MTVSPLRIVEQLDKIKDIGSGLVSRVVDTSADSELVQRGEETLRNGVIQTVASTTHRWFQAVVLKKLQVIRFLDRARNTLIYLAYSDKLIDGSPKNSISAVAMMPWGNKPPGKPIVE